MAYRAAYWVDRNTGAEVRLTSERNTHTDDMPDPAADWFRDWLKG